MSWENGAYSSINTIRKNMSGSYKVCPGAQAGRGRNWKIKDRNNRIYITCFPMTNFAVCLFLSGDIDFAFRYNFLARPFYFIPECTVQFIILLDEATIMGLKWKRTVIKRNVIWFKHYFSFQPLWYTQNINFVVECNWIPIHYLCRYNKLTAFNQWSSKALSSSGSGFYSHVKCSIIIHFDSGVCGIFIVLSPIVQSRE
jgi:hypothetical protein